MTIEKAQVKIGTLGGLGSKLDDQLEETNKRVTMEQGAGQALIVARKKLEALFDHIDKDIDENKVPEDPSVLSIAGYAKRYVKHAVEIVAQLVITSEVNAQRAQGKADGLKAAVAATKKEIDEEMAKVQALQKAMEEGTIVIEDSEDVPERAVGQHPGDPFAGRRSEVPKPPEESEPDLTKMTKAQLVEFAEAEGLTYAANWSKTRLLREIEDQLGEDDGEDT